MADTHHRRGTSSSIEGKKKMKPPRRSSPRPAITAQDREEPGTEPAQILRHEEIAERAYEIHLSRGAAPGGDLDDWLEAERQLQGRWRPPADS